MNLPHSDGKVHVDFVVAFKYWMLISRITFCNGCHGLRSMLSPKLYLHLKRTFVPKEEHSLTKNSFTFAVECFTLVMKKIH